MRRHRVLSPKGVKENDLKFFLTNGFKVDIIYLYSETNRIKSDWLKAKTNDLAVTPDSTEEGERINKPQSLTWVATRKTLPYAS